MYIPPTANVEKVTVTSTATLPVPFTRELAVPRMDGVGTLTPIVELGARADVLAPQVALVVLAVVLATALEPPLQLRRHLELKSLYWARL